MRYTNCEIRTNKDVPTNLEMAISDATYEFKRNTEVLFSYG